MRTFAITDKAVIEETIHACTLCYVGMVASDGLPYVIPMNFGYKENVIYLHSAPEGKHLAMLAQNNRVCITFCPGGTLRYQHPDVACSYSMQAKSVLCHGEVTFIDDIDDKRTAFNIMMGQYADRNFTYSEPALINVKVWKVKVNEMTCKSFGNNFK